MINAAIVGLGWWGKTLVESLNAGPAASDDIRFVAGTTRTISPELKAFADAQKFRLADNLAALLAEVAKRQAVEVQITGHTDRVGSVADNDRLSQVRAEAVRDMLAHNGLQASFIRAVGRGEREPLIPTADEQPEPQNRRVEVLVR